MLSKERHQTVVGSILQQTITNIFRRVLYAGYIEHEPWGITGRKGHHEALISLKTYERIQERKAGRMLAPAHADINLDFPLRGEVACAQCSEPMTSCWSRSATGKRYPYFWCQTKGCSLYRKNIRAEKDDAAFAQMMQSLAPSKGLMGVVKAMFADAWAQRLATR
jgi:site-specific DNA recombinase